MNRKWLRRIVLFIAVGVFLYSAYQLYSIYSEYRKGDKEYESIVDKVITEEVVEVEESGEDAPVEVNFRVDFTQLKAINNETVAWIRFEEPSKISYPVVHTSDNEKYLKTTFEQQKNAMGSLFVDAVNNGNFLDLNTFIYGHNMKNGSMFGQLKKYKSKDFCKEYPYFYIYTPDGKEITYQVFAVCTVEDTAESYRKSYADEADYEKYLKHIQGIAHYDTGVEVTATSQIVSLSTCTNVTDTQRLIVHGVKISERTVGE